MSFKYQELSFQLMVEASPTALILVNNEGKIVYLNNFAEKLFKYERRELIGQKLEILLPKSFRAHHPKLLQSFFQNPKSRQMGENRELYAQKKTGEEFPVEIGLNPIVTVDGTLVLAAINDITERKNASEEFRLVVDSAPNAMMLVDDTGHIVMVNKQTIALFGYEKKELIGQKIEKLVPQRFREHHPEHRKTFHSHPKTRAMGAGRDLYATRKDGHEIPIEIGLNLIPKGNHQFVLASIIDITERKKHDEALRHNTQQIEAKNQELEQFTAIASHDLREPLNTITSILSIIRDDEENPVDDALNQKLDYIEKSTTRMRELITGLIDYGVLGRNAVIQKIDLTDLLNTVLDDLSALIEQSNAEITLDPLPVLEVYNMEIRLLFQNLISNAIKYAHPARAPKIHISAKKKKTNWVFKITDNGIGIPEAQMQNVFLLFLQLHAKNQYSGVGIGLAHCKKIIDLHGGKIWIKSELDIGSSFYFSIPVSIDT